jgi:thiamine biosynthesis lipoprotein
MHRRDLLDPRHVANAASSLFGALDELASLATDDSDALPTEIALLRLAHRAMATTFELLLPFGTDGAMDLGTAAFERLDELEAQLTVYRDTSEVCQINRSAPFAAVPVEPGLFGLLRLAERIHSETDGAFDLTAGALIKAWGFFRGPRRVPSDEERAAALERVGMRCVELFGRERPASAEVAALAERSRLNNAVRFSRPGVEINLGGIGKGYALDRVAEYLARDCGVSSALLHGGYSSVVTVGTPPGEPRGWQVGVSHPWEPRRLATVWLRGQALGTSAATFQHLEYNGQKLGHILDPRTGWPASGTASATVVAPTGAEADALSTAFYINGVEFARRYCADHPSIGAIVLPEGAEYPEVIGCVPQAAN